MEHFYEHIDNYMSGNLSQEERVLFEQAITEDANLKYAVEHYDLGKKMSEALLELDINETLAALKEAPESTAPESSQVSKSSKPIWTRLFAFLLALIIFGALNRWYKTYQKDQVFQKAVAMRAEPIDQGGTKSTDTLRMDPFQKAKYFYASNNYERSEIILKEIIENTSNTDTLEQARHWLGFAMIRQGKEEGLELLE